MRNISFENVAKLKHEKGATVAKQSCVQEYVTGGLISGNT
jgi:hypothetical protein